MRLGVVLTQAFWYDGKQYTTKYPFASFIVELSTFVNSLILFVPLKISTSEKGPHPVYLYDNVKIIPYPFYESLKEQYVLAYRILPDFINIFKRHTNLFDICGFVSTSLLSFAAFSISKTYKKRVFIYLRADIKKAYSMQIGSSLGNFVGICLGHIEEFFCRIMTARNPTIAIGHGLYNKYKNNRNSTHLFYANLISDKMIEQSDNGGKKTGGKQVTLLSVGRLVPQKGLKYLVDAVEQLAKRKGYSPLCYIAGTGIEEAKLKTLIKQRGLTPYFIFLGDVPWGEELFDLYRKSDFFILPSITEGFPKTIFEAMAFGLPVIASNVGGISGIILNEVNGILIEPTSGGQIAAAVIKAWSSDRLYYEIIKNGHRTAKYFTVEKQTARLFSLLANDLKCC